MIRLTRRGGRQRASATPGRSSRRSGQNASRGMVTVEMAVSLITAALVVVASCWVVGLPRWPAKWLVATQPRHVRPRDTPRPGRRCQPGPRVAGLR